MLKVAKIEYDQGQQIGCGQGQNSAVFLATDPQLGGELAVKEIPKNSFGNSAGYWSEAQAMFSATHDHVVAIQYACETPSHICLAMPYYQRGSLTDRIQAGPLRPMEVIRIGQGILSGLTQIHVVGHAHLDVKPSNVLFDSNDRPLVADFGQARSIGPNGVVVPPPTMYNAGIPPELITTGHGTVASDVYQAGLTLYRAVNGDPFFHDQLMAALPQLVPLIVSGGFPDKNSFMPHVSRSLRIVLRKAMHLNSASRYGTARQFATALGHVSVSRDWATTPLLAGEMEWTCQRLPGPQLAVRIRSDGPKWKVSVYSERPGKSRATKSILWASGLTRLQAQTHLRQVFEALE
jgi:eukaryotic-like serine/threonine-protein kinase